LENIINEKFLNAYKEGEIEETKTMRKIGNSDFSTKPTNYYNLDVISMSPTDNTDLHRFIS